MPRRRNNTASQSDKIKAAKPKLSAHAHTLALHDEPHPRSPQNWFTWFAHTVARWAGKPATFLTAFVLIIAWAVSGPIFGFSDTWQLVVNTATTIVTFLMVFLIQNTQNRDTLALQIKLADLIIAMRGTHNSMAAAEDMNDADLEALHKEYRKRAEQAEASLRERRSSRAA
jgi:low affinity Fe/Cu permease